MNGAWVSPFRTSGARGTPHVRGMAAPATRQCLLVATGRNPRLMFRSSGALLLGSRLALAGGGERPLVGGLVRLELRQPHEPPHVTGEAFGQHGWLAELAPLIGRAGTHEVRGVGVVPLE